MPQLSGERSSEEEEERWEDRASDELRTEMAGIRVGLTDIRTLILRRQNTVAQYITTRLLLDLCEGAGAREGEKVPLRWWY